MVIVAALSVLAGAVCQATTGFGFSLVSAPFLIAAYRVPGGVQVNVLLSSALNLGLLAGQARAADYRAAGLLLLPGGLATFAVGAAIHHSPPAVLTVVAGALCLAGVLAVARGRPWTRITGPAGTAVVGALSGGMNVTAGIGGPPVAVFALGAGWPQATARATMQVFFLGINLLALASLGLPRDLPVVMVAALAAGMLVGRRVAAMVSPAGVRTAALLVAAAGSLLAISRGLL